MYSPDDVPTAGRLVWLLAIKAFAFISIVMVLRLRQRWRIFMLILVGLSIVLHIVVVALYSYAWTKGLLTREMLAKASPLGPGTALPPYALLVWNGTTIVLLAAIF